MTLDITRKDGSKGPGWWEVRRGQRRAQDIMSLTALLNIISGWAGKVRIR